MRIVRTKKNQSFLLFSKVFSGCGSKMLTGITLSGLLSTDQLVTPLMEGELTSAGQEEGLTGF